LFASAAAEEAPAASRVVAFEASFFSSAQPYSAFDMLALLPGYTFSESDSDVRGLAGSAGNVLIDGDRPASKQESLETLLRRIPASSVSRIELVRAGARGVDMQNHSMLANVVRIRRAQTRGSAELASEFYDRGPAERAFDAPRIAGELSRQTDEQRFEIAAALYRKVDDEHGAGHQPRIAPDGATIRETNYWKDEGARVTEVSGAYETALSSGKLRLNGSFNEERFRADSLELETFPASEAETAVELEREREAELGIHYQRSAGERSQLEFVGIHRRGREQESERNIETDEDALSLQRSKTGESIVRGVLRRVGQAWTIEGGVEGALNVLDSESELTENGVRVALPAANVRVEERRSEGFAAATWRMDARWTLEAGSRFESSQLDLTGDSTVSKSFFFAKPRALIAFAPMHDSQLRALLERKVGQLDFDDFVTSTSLSADTITAGNPDLEPDRTWLAELAWEQRFLASGSLVLAVRHERISELIDRVPISTTSEPIDGIGNIGDGERNELQVDISVPLQSFGLTTGLLKATALWRSSRTVDPTTGERRPISEDMPFEGALHFTQDLSRWSVHWGVDVELAREGQEFFIDEIRTERLGTMVNVFVEYEPGAAWKLRVFVNNLTDRTAERERQIYAGLRDRASLDYIETRTLEIGPYAGVSVRRSFGL
jgi:outer membrane receptor protein involved in Fe transport